MRLHAHPDYPHAPTLDVEARAARLSGGRLRLDYTLSGPISAVAIPAPVAPIRADQLWQHTCFEVFLRPPESEAYVEFNFSPSGEWAAYRFRTRRSGMAHIMEVDAPACALAVNAAAVVLAVDLDLSRLRDLPADQPWRVALTTIVEASDGSKSFWSLAHPQGKPDFHHTDNFALALERP